MKKIILSFLLALTVQFSFATERDSLKVLIADFNSVVQAAVEE